MRQPVSIISVSRMIIDFCGEENFSVQFPKFEVSLNHRFVFSFVASEARTRIRKRDGFLLFSFLSFHISILILLQNFSFTFFKEFFIPIVFPYCSLRTTPLEVVKNCAVEI